MGIFNNVNYSNKLNQSVTSIARSSLRDISECITGNSIVMTSDDNTRIQLLRSYCDKNKYYPTLVIGSANPVKANYEIGKNAIYDPFFGLEKRYLKPLLRAASKSQGYTLSSESLSLCEAYYILLAMNNYEISWSNLYSLCQKPLSEVSGYVRNKNISLDLKHMLSTCFSTDYQNQVALDTLLLQIADAFRLSISHNTPLINLYQMCLNQNNSVMFISAPHQETDVFYDIIAYEIGLYGQNVCVILDSVDVRSDSFARALISPGSRIFFGVFASDARRMFSSCNINFSDILSASDCIVAFNQTDEIQAQAISEALGTYEKKIVTRQTNNSRWPLRWARSSGTSETISDTPRISTSELRKLRYGCILFNRSSEKTFHILNIY